MTSPKTDFALKQIGTIDTSNGFTLTINTKFHPGLAGLDQFSHAVILWVAHETDEGSLVLDNPYTNGPQTPGVFSTRSASRPNRIGMSVAPILAVDSTNGFVELAWIDTEDQTPVVDIKPYFPSSDRVAETKTPAWCSHWPQNLEASASFDWESAFN